LEKSKGSKNLFCFYLFFRWRRYMFVLW
jgi:hypothetical protein